MPWVRLLGESPQPRRRQLHERQSGPVLTTCSDTTDERDARTHHHPLHETTWHSCEPRHAPLTQVQCSMYIHTLNIRGVVEAVSRSQWCYVRRSAGLRLELRLWKPPKPSFGGLQKTFMSRDTSVRFRCSEGRWTKNGGETAEKGRFMFQRSSLVIAMSFSPRREFQWEMPGRLGY